MFSMPCRALARPIAWRLVTTPTRHWPSHGMGVNGRSCRLPTSTAPWKECPAAGHPHASPVGNYYNNDSDLQNTLIESWNGSIWSVVASPTPPPSMVNPDLVGVACIGPSSCQAVGYYSDALDADQTLVESWTGGEWSISPSPSPGNGHGTQLFGVSCATASSCVAVGYHAAVPKPLIESWNGSTWSVVRSPNPTSAETDLFGVSCKKANQCVAVGGYYPHPGSKEKTLVESWQGTSWSITPSPSPEGTGNPYPQQGLPELDGVSCSSSDNSHRGWPLPHPRESPDPRGHGLVAASVRSRLLKIEATFASSSGALSEEVVLGDALWSVCGPEWCGRGSAGALGPTLAICC